MSGARAARSKDLGEGMIFARAYRDARRDLRALTAGITTIISSNDQFNEGLCRATADLYMLASRTPEGIYPFAGIPWYSTVFGRDGIITAMMALWIDPKFARGVLRYLAATQAKAVDPAADAQPGKVLHETRRGEMAMLGEVPFRHYYGTIDGTPLFVMLAWEYYAVTGDLETDPGDLAGARTRPRMDGPLRRPGRRRLRRIRPRHRQGAGEPGLEGQPRFDLPRRRSARQGADRPVRGAGLRLRGQARHGEARRAARARSRWPSA